MLHEVPRKSNDITNIEKGSTSLNAFQEVGTMSVATFLDNSEEMDFILVGEIYLDVGAVLIFFQS